MGQWCDAKVGRREHPLLGHQSLELASDEPGQEGWSRSYLSGCQAVEEVAPRLKVIGRPTDHLACSRKVDLQVGLAEEGAQTDNATRSGSVIIG